MGAALDQGGSGRIRVLSPPETRKSKPDARRLLVRVAPVAREIGHPFRPQEILVDQ
jgi:hypothetical protein